jgi:hypothetical protein
MIDHDRLAALAMRDPRIHARNASGPDGAAMVGRLIERVRAIYRVMSPEQITTGLTVVEPLAPHVDPSCSASVVGRDLQQVDELPDHYRESLTVVAMPGAILRTSRDVLAPGDVVEADAVYHFDPTTGERIYVAGREFIPDNPTGLLSAFAVPTFATLERALGRYAIDFARYGAISELRGIWRDESRLMFHEAPEQTMRRSLEAFLVATLREIRAIDVRPETPIDESHPIDLRVIFTHTNRTALIEIKWMGDSADAAGGSHVRYRDARAKSGAQQLADYLDADRPRSTGHVVLGYLVLYDARRRGITPHTTSINRADGMFYEHRDVTFPPNILARQDFATPLRMFMEPVCG